MKAITVKQPWASLIVEGIKDIENRTWATKYRGRVLIHAGLDKKLTHMFPTSFMSTQQVSRIMQQDVDYKLLDDKWCIYGAIIGSVEIVDCVINHPSVWAEKSEFSPFTVNGEENEGFRPTYNWVLANPIKFDEPILNVKGKLSFWEYKTE